MITDIIIAILSWVLNGIVYFLPKWSIFPPEFLDGLKYFFQTIGGLNIIFPIDKLFSVLLFLLSFEIAYYSAKLIISIVAFFTKREITI